MRKGILNRIKESDSVYIYKLPDDRWLDREIIGQMRMPTDAII
ncbi:TPA: CRISPR-associated endonuclease Cas2 [Candidatus Poribacteria bacterium]|nr:CRISPR-associated endonuclease Cas2 [Candidatus Poribacteria bacterium]